MSGSGPSCRCVPVCTLGGMGEVGENEPRTWAGRPLALWAFMFVFLVAFTAARENDALWVLLVALLAVSAVNAVVVRVRERRRSADPANS